MFNASFFRLSSVIKMNSLHWDLRVNPRQKEYNHLLRRLDVDYCVLGCFNVWINLWSICYSFSFLFLLTRICWADPYWETGRFHQLLLTIRHKLTPLHMYLYSSITGSLKVVIYQQLGQGILIKDCRAPPLKSDHQIMMVF